LAQHEVQQQALGARLGDAEAARRRHREVLLEAKFTPSPARLQPTQRRAAPTRVLGEDDSMQLPRTRSRAELVPRLDLQTALQPAPQKSSSSPPIPPHPGDGGLDSAGLDRGEESTTMRAIVGGLSAPRPRQSTEWTPLMGNSIEAYLRDDDSSLTSLASEFDPQGSRSTRPSPPFRPGTASDPPVSSPPGRKPLVVRNHSGLNPPVPRMPILANELSAKPGHIATRLPSQTGGSHELSRNHSTSGLDTGDIGGSRRGVGRVASSERIAVNPSRPSSGDHPIDPGVAREASQSPRLPSKPRRPSAKGIPF